MTIPLNAFDREEHDGDVHGKNVSIVKSTATLYAVVNTGTAGQASVVVDGPVSIKGNLTLSDSHSFIGLTTTVIGSAPTIYAVVNTAAGGGNVTVEQGTSPWATSILGNLTIDSGTVSIKGNVTLSSSQSFIGLVTAVIGNSTSQPVAIQPPLAGYLPVSIDQTSPNNVVQIKGNITISNSNNFIGLVTVGGGTLDNVTTVGTITNPVSIKGNLTIDSGTITAVTNITNPVAIKGNITLSDPKTYIGLVSISHAAWANPNAYIGLVTATAKFSNVTLSASPNFIGLVTVVQSSAARTITGNVTLSDAKTFIGLVTIGGMSTVTLSDSKTFIGLVTAWSRNAGTTKTLIPKTITLSSSSVATIAVPTNTFYVTNVLISSDATVRVSIKSDVTYLTGNASIGVVLNPGGGWAERGSPDSPSFIGLAAAKAIVVEKFDMTGTKANVGGKVIYYEE